VLCRLAVAQADALDVEAAPATTLLALDGLAVDAVDEAAALIVRVTEALGEGAPISAYEPLVRRGLELVGEARDARWARLPVLLDPVEPVGNGALRVGRWRGHPPDALAALRASGLEEDEARTIEPFRARTEKDSIALLEQSRRWSSARARLRVLDVVGRDFSLRHRQPLVAVDCYRGLLELGERVGSLPAQAEGSAMLAMCLALTGDLAGSERQLARARDLVHDVWPGHRAHLVGTISSSVIVGYLRGTADWSGMAGRLSQWLAGPGPAHAPFAIVFAALAALCHSFAGERDNAERMLDEVIDLIGLMDVRDHAVAGTLWFSAASVWELHDGVRAERLSALIDRHLAAGGPPGPASLAHARGMVSFPAASVTPAPRSTGALQSLIESRRLAGLVVAFCEGGCVPSGDGIEAGGELEITVLLVEVGGDRFAPRDVFVDLGQCRQSCGRAVGLADCDGTVEPDDRSVGEPE
jgi:hypothetical protein